MSDILDRLRTLNGGWHDDLATEAILEITRLREQVEQCRWRRVEDELPERTSGKVFAMDDIGRAYVMRGSLVCANSDEMIFWMPIPPLLEQWE